MRHIIFALLISISSAWVAAQAGKPLELAASAPDRHIVVPGDTLWGISAKFLKDPYRWGELWKLNPDEVKNPHRIYPGQVLVLDKSGMTPQLKLETVKVSPREYVESYKKAIPSIPPQAIEPFLIEPLVLEDDGLDGAARVIALQDTRVLAGAGDRLYATNVGQPNQAWQVFRPGPRLIDPESRATLGYEALFLGNARQLSEGDPAEFVLQTSKQEVTMGDRLLPTPRPDVVSYIPRAPGREIRGRVLGTGGVNFAGQYAVVSLNRGRVDGIEEGHVLAVDIAGAKIVDRFKGQRKEFVLPDQQNGLLFVFRVFNKVSYALVMDAVKPISVGDTVHTP
jgi:hypothetical protein